MKPFHLFILVLVMSALTLFYVRSRFLAVELNYEVNQKTKMKQLLEKEKRELHLELSVLQSPRRIEKKAKEKFDLKYSSNAKSKKLFLDIKN